MGTTDPGGSPVRGIALALVAYSALSFGDAFIKSLGGRLSVFEIGLFIAVAGFVVVPFVKPRGVAWRTALRPQRPLAVLGRAATGLAAGGLGIYAFTHIPFTQAYALIFMAPLLTALLSRVLLDERIGRRGWLAIGFGFAGMLLIVRPGVEPPTLGHAAALGVAVMMAGSVVILRTIAAHESRAAILTVQMSVAALVYAAALLVSGTASTPTPDDLARLAGAALFALIGQVALIAATAAAPAGRVAPAQYCQLGWAVVIGSVMFGEHPDAPTLLGLALIAACGFVMFGRPRRVVDS